MPTHFVALCACRLQGSHPLLCNIIGGRLFAHQAEPDRKQVAPGFGYKLAHQASLLYASPQTGGANLAGFVPAFFVAILQKKYFLNFQKVFLCCFCFYNKLLIFLLYDFLNLSTTKFIFKLKHNLF